MADEKPDPPTERPPRSKKRPPPTIDLQAKEVKAQAPPAADAPANSEAAGSKADAASGTSGSFLKYAGIGASVSAGVVATLAVLWFASHLPTGGGGAAIRDRLAALEAQAGAKPNAPPVDPQVLAALSQRLDKLEQAVGKLAASPQTDTALDQRVTTVENAMKSLGATLPALVKRADDIASSSSAMRDRAEAVAKAVEAVQSRIDTLERSAKATQDKVAQNSGADAAARRALAAFALREAAVSGAPYSAELASAKSTGLDGAKAAALEPFAATGLPNDAALAREMSSLLPKLMAVSGAGKSQDVGFIDRLQANAGKLVRIHPVGRAEGDDVSAVLARIEANTANNNVSGIAAELMKLPANMREPAAAWSQKVAARDAALAAARDLARDAVAALAAH